MFHRTFQDRRSLDILLFLLLSILVSGAIGYLKLESLMKWGYTSDLFSFDTVLSETLRGHVGVEFTFGNTFGDHAYVFLFFLLPIKLLLQANMVRLLVLLGPAALLISSNVLFWALWQMKGFRFAFLAAGTFLIGFLYTFRGIYEEIYGFHPDTLSGYLAVAFCSFLIWREFRQRIGSSTAIQTAGFWVFFVLFISLKEEMALLGSIFFLTALILRRDRLNFTALLAAGLTTAAEFLFVRFSQTSFNRTNELLLAGFLQELKNSGLYYFFRSSFSSPEEVISYWLALSLLTISFISFALLARKVQRNALCLLVIGLMKLALSLISADFSLAGWHNFPGFMMLIGAVVWQASMLDDQRIYGTFRSQHTVRRGGGRLFGERPAVLAGKTCGKPESHGVKSPR